MREDRGPTKADLVRFLCGKYGVCAKEALFYLRGCRWDLDAATEACRSKTLETPSVTLGLSSEAPRTQPLMTGSPGPEERNQMIERFCAVAHGAIVEYSTSYLSRSNWNLQVAVDDFLKDFQRMASIRKEDDTNETSEDKGPSVTVPLSSEAPRTQPLLIGSPGHEERNQMIERFCEVVLGATVESATSYLNQKKWNLKVAFDDYFEDFQRMASHSSPQIPRKDDTKKTWDVVRRECYEEFLRQAPEATFMEARSWLEKFKWKVEEALQEFFTQKDGQSPDVDGIEHNEENVYECDHCNIFTGTEEEMEIHVKSCSLRNKNRIGSTSSQEPRPESRVTREPSDEDDTETSADEGPSDELRMGCLDAFSEVAPEATYMEAKSCLEKFKWNLEDALQEFFKPKDGQSPDVAGTERKEQDVVECDQCNIFRGTEEERKIHVKSCSLRNKKRITSTSSQEPRRKSLRLTKEPIRFVAGEPSATFPCIACPKSFSSTRGRAIHESVCTMITMIRNQRIFEHPRGQRNPRIDRNVTEPDVVSALLLLPNAEMEIAEGDAVQVHEEEVAMAEGDVAVHIAEEDLAITIVLNDGSGASLNLTFTANQTIRHIHEAIDEQEPSDTPYYLQSLSGEVDYTDLDTTVGSIYGSGNTILVQILGDP